MKGRLVAGIAAFVAILALLAWLALRDDRPALSRDGPPAADAPAKTTPHTPDAVRARAKAPETCAPDETPAAPAAPAGPTARGRVIDADGNPVAGARVVSHPDDLSKVAALGSAGADGSRTFTTRSDADGRFVVRVDPAAVMTIYTAESDTAGFGQVYVTRDAEPTVRVRPWGTIAGHVRDKDKNPIAGATVRLGILLDALTLELATTTDADGAYRLERVPPRPAAGEWVARGQHVWGIASAVGYAPLLIERGGMGGKPAPDDAYDFTLVRGATLEGKVVDAESGAPIDGARVVCWSVEAEMWFVGVGGQGVRNPWAPRPLQETTSGEDGSFRFEHLPAQGPSGVASHSFGNRGMTMGYVAAWKDGWAPASDEVPAVNDGATTEATLKVWPAARVTGRVVDPAGTPVPDATVWAGVDGRTDGAPSIPWFYPEAANAYPRTDAEGRYRFEGIRASRAGPSVAKLFAHLRIGQSAAAKVEATVEVRAGETTDAPDLVLDASAVPTANFLVVDPSGHPVVGATIEERGRQLLRTGLDGRFTYALDPADLRAKDGRVLPRMAILRARGFAPVSVEFTPAVGTPAEVRVELKAGQRVSGRVLRADGTTFAKASITVGDGNRAVAEVFSDRPWQPASDAQGRPILAVYSGAVAAEDGTFTVVDLPDGPYHVSAFSYGKSLVPGRQPKVLRDVRSGVVAGATDVVLTIPADDAPPTQPLDVAVTDPLGKPVEGATAVAVGPAGTVYAQKQPGGSFRFHGLTAGTWIVTARAPGFAPTDARPVEVAADVAPVAITIALDRGATVRGTVRAAEGTLPPDAALYLVPTDTLARRPDWNPTTLSKDGTFEGTGLLPGAYRAVVMGGDPSGPDRKVLVSDGNAVVQVAGGARAAAADVALVVAGTLHVSVKDARLPPVPFGGEAFDAAKEAFGADAAFEVLTPAGVLVERQRGLFANMSAGFWLAPGDYVIRLRLPGDEPREERRTLAAAATVSVRFATQ